MESRLTRAAVGSGPPSGHVRANSEPGRIAFVEQRLSLVTLGVADLARARSFYEALGWKTGASPAEDVVFFQAGGMIVALWGRQQLAEDTVVEDSGGWGGVTPAHNQPAPPEGGAG